MTDIKQIQKNDILLEALVELANELGKYDIPLVIGGGLSLYLRSSYLQKNRSLRYKYQAYQRSTKDIDIFLTSNLILNEEKITLFRDALVCLGYSVKTEYFQFEKTLLNKNDSIQLDILAAPPPGMKLNSREIRIKPENTERFHARRNNEAAAIDFGLIPGQTISDKLIFGNLFLVSSINYLILKLHAFKDRVNDKIVDFGRHHAYDIFATVIDMDENDWSNARAHYLKDLNEDYFINSGKIVLQFFSDENSMGVIRLKENELYIRNKGIFDTYIHEFIKDLKDVFFL